MRNKPTAIFIALLLSCAAITAHAFAPSLVGDKYGTIWHRPQTTHAFASSPVGDEYGFSPEGSAKALVLKVMDASTLSLDVMAYGFTSQEVTTALIDAARRGVAVRVVVDYKANVGEDRSGAAGRALPVWLKRACRCAR